MSLRPLLLAPLALFACGGFEERPVQVVFAPGATDFWSKPLPSDLRREADGTFDLEKWPGAWRPNEVVEMWLASSEERLKNGWGVSSGVFVPLSGAIDPASLPQDARAAMREDASVYLLDIDPNSPEKGRRSPIDVSFLEKGDLYSPDNLLAAVPVFGFVRRTNTIYALVVTDAVRDASGGAIGRSEAFHRALEDEDPHFAPLIAALEADALEHVAGAAVFKTFDHEALLLDLAKWAEAQPEPVLSAPWTETEDHASFRVFTARFEVPVIQSGRRPYDSIGEGRIVLDSSGAPVAGERQAIELVLSVPKIATPASGFPLTFVLHGSGGNRRMAVDRGPKEERKNAPDAAPGTGPAEWLARRGVATVALDFPLHGVRHTPPDTTGLVFYNLFGNIDATIDNFHVAIVEMLLWSRLMTSTSLLIGDETVRFDAERFTALSQSMGTTLGVPWAGVDPRVKGLVFSGAGGILVEIAVTALEPTVLKPTLESLMGLSATGAELHLAHPMLHAFQNVWDWVDPIAKAPRVSVAPHPGFEPRHVLMTAGVRDGYFHPRSQAAMALALGAPLAGDEIEPILPGVLQLGGIAAAQYPVANNVNGRTVGVVQYASPEEQGHYVVFNQEGARHQYTCFIASVAGDTAKLSEAGALNDACR